MIKVIGDINTVSQLNSPYGIEVSYVRVLSPRLSPAVRTRTLFLGLCRPPLPLSLPRFRSQLGLLCVCELLVSIHISVHIIVHIHKLHLCIVFVYHIYLSHLFIKYIIFIGWYYQS